MASGAALVEAVLRRIDERAAQAGVVGLPGIAERSWFCDTWLRRVMVPTCPPGTVFLAAEGVGSQLQAVKIEHIAEEGEADG